MAKPRLAFLDDYSILLEGVKHVAGNVNDFGELDLYTSPSELMQNLKQNIPDLLVLEIAIGKTNGLSLLREIRNLHPDLKIAIFTQHDSEIKFKESIGLGVQGYILKTEQAGLLPEIFLRILNGEFYFSKEIQKYSNKNPSQYSLQDIEVQIIDLMRAGKSMREIGSIMNITPKVVEYRLKKVRRMYDAKNNPELIAKMREG